MEDHRQNSRTTVRNIDTWFYWNHRENGRATNRTIDRIKDRTIDGTIKRTILTADRTIGRYNDRMTEPKNNITTDRTKDRMA